MCVCVYALCYFLISVAVTLRVVAGRLGQKTRQFASSCVSVALFLFFLFFLLLLTRAVGGVCSGKTLAQPPGLLILGWLWTPTRTALSEVMPDQYPRYRPRGTWHEAAAHRA